MNLGWYEIMDRIAMIQDQLENSTGNYQDTDKDFYVLIQSAQEKLYESYKYACEKFNDSCEEY